MNANPAVVARLPDELPALDWVTDPAASGAPVARLRLVQPGAQAPARPAKTADLAVRPRTEAEIRAVVARMRA